MKIFTHYQRPDALRHDLSLPERVAKRAGEAGSGDHHSGDAGTALSGREKRERRLRHSSVPEADLRYGGKQHSRWYACGKRRADMKEIKVNGKPVIYLPSLIDN